MLEWCLVYEGGKTYSNEDGSPFDAPGSGVQAVIFADPDIGHGITHGCDCYWYDKGTWFGLMDKHGWGLMIYMLAPGPKKVVYGTTTSTQREFQAALALASKVGAERFPPKSAKSTLEA